MPKTRASLLAHLLEGVDSACGRALWEDLADWVQWRRRFEELLDANRDKVRKKLRSAAGDDALLDVRAELLVASLLSVDRRFVVQFEAYGSGRRGPDLSVTFREHQRFNVEVTRLRPWDGEAAPRLQAVLLAKPRQLPAGVPNVLAVVVPHGASLASDDVAAAAKHLQQLADRKEEAAFTRRGYKDARDYLAYFARLSGVLVTGSAQEVRTVWLNPQGRHQLPRDALAALTGASS